MRMICPVHFGSGLKKTNQWPFLVVSHDSIRGCVRPWVRPSVSPSVGHALFFYGEFWKETL